jgi:hypothetical protein
MACEECGTEKQAWHELTEEGCIQCHNLKSRSDISDTIWLVCVVSGGLVCMAIALIAPTVFSVV